MKKIYKKLKKNLYKIYKKFEEVWGGKWGELRKYWLEIPEQFEGNFKNSWSEF